MKETIWKTLGVGRLFILKHTFKKGYMRMWIGADSGRVGEQGG